MILLISPIRFINSLRHAYGFGVHSPFAFDLILNTLHCSHSYYSYAQNRAKINKAGLLKQADIKYAELLFRLTNRFGAKNILEIGSGCGINTLYMGASSSDATFLCVEKEEEKTNTAKMLLSNKKRNITFSKGILGEKKRYDAIIWDLELYPLSSDEEIVNIQDSLKEGSFIVVKHINSNNHNKKVWEEIKKMDQFTMSFNLGSIGIGFIKSSLPKINYDVYF